MGRKKLNKRQISITLQPEVADELLLAAAEEGRDRSDLIAELAREYLRKREKDRGDKPKKK
jgi:metal-responsive CopG/Arc/MetJ family transcriptional regulator